MSYLSVFGTEGTIPLLHGPTTDVPNLSPLLKLTITISEASYAFELTRGRAVLSDWHGSLLPLRGLRLPPSTEAHPLLLLPVDVLDDFLARKGVKSTYDALEAKPRQMLLWMVVGDRPAVDASAAKPFSQVYDEFAATHCEWCEPRAVRSHKAARHGDVGLRVAVHQPEPVLFWEHGVFAKLELDAFMTCSIQKSGRCFMHAAVHLQHLLVVKATQHVGHEKINISKFVADHFSGKALKNYLEENGGDSVQFLMTIANVLYKRLRYTTLRFSDVDDVAIEESRAAARKSIELLQVQGPALVSGFYVDDRFPSAASHLADRCAITRPPSGGPPQTHSMLLIGARESQDHEFVFLLQNWWEYQQLVEVSLGYLMSARADVNFVFTELTEIPRSFPTLIDAVTECYVDSAGDGVLSDRALTDGML
eukprot:m.22824 g.22824  ORF g.22824 m.22824 type:complete len:422 (-) comp3803_c0_seq2:1722-2987(-)